MLKTFTVSLLMILVIAGASNLFGANPAQEDTNYHLPSLAAWTGTFHMRLGGKDCNLKIFESSRGVLAAKWYDNIPFVPGAKMKTPGEYNLFHSTSFPNQQLVLGNAKVFAKRFTFDGTDGQTYRRTASGRNYLAIDFLENNIIQVTVSIVDKARWSTSSFGPSAWMTYDRATFYLKRK